MLGSIDINVLLYVRKTTLVRAMHDETTRFVSLQHFLLLYETRLSILLFSFSVLLFNSRNCLNRQNDNCLSLQKAVASAVTSSAVVPAASEAVSAAYAEAAAADYCLTAFR